MYAKGMTTGDIEAHIQDIYGIEVSDTTISRITDKILPIAKEWQQRSLEAVYAVVFLDAIHYHVRSEGQVEKKAVYVYPCRAGTPNDYFPHIVSTSVGLAKKETLRNQSLFCYARK